MSKDFGQGIFSMDFIKSLERQRDLGIAREAAIKQIDESSATDENKTKARQMISKANTVQKLLLGMANFSLSHQGLKVIR